MTPTATGTAPFQAKARLEVAQRPPKVKPCRRCKQPKHEREFPLNDAPKHTRTATAYWCAGCLVERGHLTRRKADQYAAAWDAARRGTIEAARAGVESAVKVQRATRLARRRERLYAVAARQEERAAQSKPEHAIRADEHQLTVDLLRLAESDPMFARAIQRAARMLATAR